MPFQSSREIEAALRQIGFSKSAIAPFRAKSRGEAAHRAHQAIRCFIDDKDLWASFENVSHIALPIPPGESAKIDEFKTVLSDEYINQLQRVGYRPPPSEHALLDLMQRIVSDALTKPVPPGAVIPPKRELVNLAKSSLTLLCVALENVKIDLDKKPANGLMKTVNGVLVAVHLMGGIATGADLYGADPASIAATIGPSVIIEMVVHGFGGMWM